MPGGEGGSVESTDEPVLELAERVNQPSTPQQQKRILKQEKGEKK